MLIYIAPYAELQRRFMPFSDEGNALIKNLHQYKEYSSWRLLTEFAEIKWNERAFNSLLKKDPGNRKHRRKDKDKYYSECIKTIHKPVNLVK